MRATRGIAAFLTMLLVTAAGIALVDFVIGYNDTTGWTGGVAALVGCAAGLFVWEVAAMSDQSWFWTPEWQAGERQADADIAEGRTLFHEPDEPVADVLAAWEATSKHLTGRDPDRIDPMIEQLRAAWKANPDMRLGQLLFNAARADGRPVPPCPEFFYIEDGPLLAGIRPDPWDQCLDVDPFTGQPDHEHGDACENPDCS